MQIRMFDLGLFSVTFHLRLRALEKPREFSDSLIFYTECYDQQSKC